MKKFIKQFITLCLLGTIVITSTVDSYAAKTSRYGFTYNNSYYNANWKTMETIYVYSSKGGKLGSMSFVVGLARRKKTNNYLLMAKEIMTPNKNKVKLDSKNTYEWVCVC